LDFAKLGLGIISRTVLFPFQIRARILTNIAGSRSNLGIDLARVPTHHNIASPYIKSSLDDLLELHTKSLIPLKPLSPLTRLEATRAPPSGQGALPEPPEAAQPLALDRRWPEQAIVDRFEVEKKDTAASPSSPPDLVKLTVRIPDATTPF
jgi:hypothetical protein